MKRKTGVQTVRYVDLPEELKDFVEFTPEESRVLATVNQRVAAGRTLDEVMAFVFAETRAICPCDRIGVAFVEEDGARVTSRWVQAAYEPLRLGVGYGEDLAGSSLEAVIRAGTPRIIDDLAAYLEARPESRSTRLLVEEGVRSSMTCPLQVDGRTVGLLFRSSRRTAAYDETQVRLHAAIAARLAQAVEKAHLIQRLEAANAAYLEMLAFVSHELKNPLASIVMDVEVLSGGYLGALAADQRATVERIARKAAYLGELVRDYLELARVEGGDLEPTVVAGVDLVAAVIEPAIDLLRPQFEARRITLERAYPAGGAVPVATDPALLTVVATNLIGNAVKYGDEGGRVRVAVETATDAVTVRVWNQGPGFAADERPRLFRKFSRLQAPELQRRKGSGVGLYTCSRIVRALGGTIRADSQPGAWAEFSFSLPVGAIPSR